MSQYLPTIVENSAEERNDTEEAGFRLGVETDSDAALKTMNVDDERCLKRTYLLRIIVSEVSSAFLTESTIKGLELIDDLDSSQGLPVGRSIRAAYCAVAVECTTRFLIGAGGKPGVKYKSAVDRIWRYRIGRMESLTPELLQWKDELEAAILDDSVCDKLMELNTRADAIASLRIYLEKAWGQTRLREEEERVSEGLNPFELVFTKLSYDGSDQDEDKDSYGTLTTPDGIRLKSSLLEFVTDPAIQMGETMISDENLIHQHSFQNQNVEEADDLDPSPNLMDPQEIGFTFPLNGDVSLNKGFGSPSTKFKTPKVSKRREVKRWSAVEEETLRASVLKIGIGNWKMILQSNREIFERRTEVDLKDKWRNITRSRMV